MIPISIRTPLLIFALLFAGCKPPPGIVRLPQLLPPHPTLLVVRSALSEHERLTGQSFKIGEFKNLEGADLEQSTHQVFLNWKLEKVPLGNGILLALFDKEHQARLEVGFGLSSVLTDSISQDIASNIQDFHSLQLDQEDSLGQAVYHILDLLNSPLIQSGKLQELFASKSSIEPEASTRLNDPAPSTAAWIFFVLLGLALVSFSLFKLLSREAHFTRSGWYRPFAIHSWKQKRLKHTHSPIVQALQAAEDNTMTEIRVHLTQRWFERNPTQNARQVYKTQVELSSNRYSILMYINLRTQKFAFVGSPALIQSLGNSSWHPLEQVLQENLRSTQSERAITLTIASIGKFLTSLPPR